MFEDHEPHEEKLREGIGQIFASGYSLRRSRENPMSLNDVRPEIKTEILSLLGQVRDFGGAQRLCQYINDPDASFSQISQIIMMDPVLTGKILRAANSAYFGNRKIDSILQAMNLLGLNTIKGIVFMKTLSNIVRKKACLTDVIIELLWQHSVLTSTCAPYVADAVKGVDRDALFTLALLHDIGKFINADRFHTLKDVGECTMPYMGEFTVEYENQLFGINHCLLGNMAFQNWGLSRIMIETVTMHHEVECKESDEIGLPYNQLNYLVAFFLANQTAKLFVPEQKRRLFQIQVLPQTYHLLVKRDLLERRILTKSLFQEIEKAKVLAEMVQIPVNAALKIKKGQG